MYKSEAAFSNALLTALRKKAKRLLILRIESGDTARGIPDLYIRNSNREYWVELKNLKRQSVMAARWQVSWRPGQQTWAAKYLRCSNMCSYTIAALDDGFMIIPMLTRFHNNMVYCEQRPIRMTALGDVVDCLLEGLENYVR
jgi:hypothetical protein